MRSQLCLLLAVLVLGLVEAQYSRNYTSSRTRVVTTNLPVPAVSRFRYECRNVFPSRSDIASHGVVVTGKVEDIKQDNDDADDTYMAAVQVKRVFLGPRNLRKARITVAGLGAHGDWCHSNVKRGDTWIFVLQPITYPDYFRLNSSLIKPSLNNLEKIEGIVSDDPFRKLTTVIDLPCEKKYCPNNGICVEDKYGSGGIKCECLTYCKPNYAPVCGSNDETYNNECELRMKSCLAGKNVFVKGLAPCKPAYTSYSPSTSSSTSYRSSSSSSQPSQPSSPARTYTSSYSSTSYRSRPSESSPERAPSPPYTGSITLRREPSRTEPQTTRERTYTRTQTTTVNRYQY